MKQKSGFAKRLWLLALITLCSATYMYAQTGKITGKVVSQDDGSPVDAVAVSIKGKSTGSYTNEKGEFSFNANPGSYIILFSYMGSKPIEKAVNLASNQTANLGAIRIDVSAQMLEEVVVDGMIKKFAQKKSDFVARMPIKNLENPQAYTVVPKELFTEQVAVDFQSALMSSPGVGNVSQGPGSGGIGLGIRMRGFSSLNGAGAIRNGMATNFVSLSDPANLESLEIIKGPSATLFGSTLISYGGLVNRVTKKAFAGKAGEAGLTTGAGGLGRLTFDYNTPLNDDKTFMVRLNTAIHREKSFQDYGINRSIMIAPTFTYIVNDKLTVDVDFEYFQTERTATYVRVGSAAGITNIDQLNWDFKKSYTSNELLCESKVFNVFGKATYKLSDSWTSQTQYSYANTENNANYLFLTVNKKDTITPSIMNIPSTFTTNQVQQNFIGDFKIGNIRNRLLLGVDYTQLVNTNDRATVAYSNIPISGNFAINIYKYQQSLASAKRAQALRSERTVSAYASDVVNLSDRFTFMASLRVDRFHDVANDYTQTTLSPKMGLVYQLLKDKVSVFGNFMDGFQNVAPALSEDNPDKPTSFKPEHANQWEGGLKVELFDGKLNGTLSYYDINVKDRVRTVAGTDGVTYSIQDGTQRSKGFEADLIANPIKGMHIILGYGYNDSKYTKGDPSIVGKHPYAIPHHIANFWVSHKFQHGVINGFGLGLGGNYSSDHFLDSDNKITVPGYFKLDATAFYEQTKYRISLKLNNLTDKEYWTSSFNATPQATRQFIANVTYRF